MKLSRCDRGTRPYLAWVENNAAAHPGAADTTLPTDLYALTLGGTRALTAAKAAAATVPASARLPLDQVTPLLPVQPAAKIICVGLNYALHAKEGGHAIPTYPSFFLRVYSSLLPARAPVVRPKLSAQLDYEC